MTKTIQDQSPPLVSDESSQIAEHLGQTINEEWNKIDKHWKAWRACLIIGFLVFVFLVIVLSQNFFARWDKTISLVETTKRDDQAAYDQQGQIIKDQIQRMNTLRALNSKLSVHVAVSSNAHENLRRATNALLDDKEVAQSLPEKHRSALIRAINQTKDAIKRNDSFWEVHRLMTSTETTSISTP